MENIIQNANLGKVPEFQRGDVTSKTKLVYLLYSVIVFGLCLALFFFTLYASWDFVIHKGNNISFGGLFIILGFLLLSAFLFCFSRALYMLRKNENSFLITFSLFTLITPIVLTSLLAVTSGDVGFMIAVPGEIFGLLFIISLPFLLGRFIKLGSNQARLAVYFLISAMIAGALSSFF